MEKRRRCVLTYDEKTGIGCDLYAGHAGPCDTTHSRAAALANARAALREAELDLIELETGHRPRNRSERRRARR